MQKDDYDLSDIFVIFQFRNESLAQIKLSDKQKMYVLDAIRQGAEGRKIEFEKVIPHLTLNKEEKNEKENKR